MADRSTRESGYGTDPDEMEKQFKADLEKAKALSMETAALEKFRHMTPAAAISKGDENWRQRRITHSNSQPSVGQENSK